MEITYTSPKQEKLNLLMEQEETARIELTAIVETIQECKVPREQFVQTVEHVLTAITDYMKNVKELTDTIKG